MYNYRMRNGDQWWVGVRVCVCVCVGGGGGGALPVRHKRQTHKIEIYQQQNKA